MTKALHNRVNRKELRRKVRSETKKRITLSFYAYTNLEDPVQFRNDFYRSLTRLEVLGRIYVAHEGVNAQISVPAENLDALKTYLNSIDFLNGIRLNIAVEDDGKSFFTLAVKVRNKIVADGLEAEDFDVRESGVHLNAIDFNKIADQEDTIIVDMRNH